MLVGEAVIFELQHRCGNTAQDKCGWCCVFQCSWVEKTNHTYLSNPSLTACQQTHICTQEQIYTDILNMQTPSGETGLTQSWMCLLPYFFETTVLPLGETGKPCLEDNLGGTIWSRFSLFSLFFFPWKDEKKMSFCSFEMQLKSHMDLIYFLRWIIQRHL